MGSDGCRSSTKDLTGKTEKKNVTIHSNLKKITFKNEGYKIWWASTSGFVCMYGYMCTL